MWITHHPIFPTKTDFFITFCFQNEGNYCIMILEKSMKNQNLVVPRKLAGFMELMPEKQVIFEQMIDKIKEVYKISGFVPLDTPILELSEVLFAKSGNTIDKEVYRFTKGDTDMCMRYDLTVPLARFVASNSENLTYPFKRYQIGKVFRGERPQKGRFREFVQCDADIIGNEELPIVADAECIKVIDKVFKALNLEITNNISNRNVLFGYCEGLGYKDKTQEILTILDKIDKMGKENANKELKELGVKDSDAEKFIFITSQKGNFEDVLNKIENLCENELYQLGINQLKELYSYIKCFRLNENNYCLNLGIIRGQNYYTGTVFETVITSHPEFGTVCGGGRYDNLTGYFTEKKFPGVGFGIGLTRIFDLLDQNNMLPNVRKTEVKLEIIPLGQTILDCLSLVQYFSDKIVCDVNYDNRSLKAKMREANKKEIPYIIVVGEDEIKSQKFNLKNMESGETTLLTKEEILNLLSK